MSVEDLFHTKALIVYEIMEAINNSIQLYRYECPNTLFFFYAERKYECMFVVDV